jgi:hypothetical protein
MDVTESKGGPIKRYPDRPSFFALRYGRLLSKAAVAQQIGPEGCWVLMTIVLTEDVTRYTRAVTFWNDQLLSVCGFGSRRRLDAARKRAVECGFLHYQPGGKSRPGEYHVLVPPSMVGITDSPIVEDVSRDVLGCNSAHENAPTNIYPCNSAHENALNVHSMCASNSTPFIPSPKPTPKNTVTHSEKASPKTKTKRPSVQCPSDVDPQTFADWQTVRTAKRAGPVTQTVLRSMTNEADKAGISLQRAVEIAAARGWQTFKADWAWQDASEQQPVSRYNDLTKG